MTTLPLHLAELAAFASLFIFASASAGNILLRIFGIRIDDSSLAACAGLTPILIVLFYLQESQYAIPFVWLSLLIGIASLTYYLIDAAKNKSSYIKGQFSDIALTVTLVALIYGLFSGTNGPATYANNDLYNWYSVASTLVGQARYSEMSPFASDYWRIFAHDGYGTNWMLGLVGFVYKDPIQSSTIFLVIVSSWLALIFQWQLRNIFNAKRFVALPLSVLPLTSAFYIYLAFNSFYAQLLGTVGAALAFNSILKIYSGERQAIGQRYTLLVIPVLWSLYVYQSGFIAFQFIVVGFAFSLALFHKFSFDNFLKSARYFLYPYLLALLTAVTISPRLVIYLIERSREVGSVVAGWPLPRIPPDVFMGFPWFSGSAWLHDGANHGGTLLSYLTPSFILLGGVIAAFTLHKKNKLPDHFRIIASLWTWYALLIGIYLFWFSTGSSQYQNWKFASFFIFSTVALPLGTIALFLHIGLENLKLKASDTKTVQIISATTAVLVVALSQHNLRDSHKKITKIGPKINQLINIRDSLPQATKVNIDLGEYGDSMLPMLILSSKVSLNPLSTTYLPPAARVPDRPGVVSLTSAKCADLRNRLAYPHKGNELVRTEDYVVHAENIFFGYRFDQNGAHCGLKFRVSLDSGFYNLEPWGVWTNGKSSELTIELPQELRGNRLRIDLDVQPYISEKTKVQRVRVLFNNGQEKFVQLSSPGVISLTLDGLRGDQDKVTLNFELLDATAPSDVDPKNLDTRKLGIGLIGLGVREASGSH